MHWHRRSGKCFVRASDVCRAASASPDRDSPAAERAPQTMQLEPGLRQVELAERIRWLINLRWIAFAGVGVTILLTRSAFESALPFGRLALTTLAIPLYNLLFYIAWRRARHNDSAADCRVSTRHANAQILCDLTILGLLIHFSGGVETPFCFYYVYHMAIASILLTRRSAFAMATYAVIELSFIFSGEYSGLLPHYQSPIGVQFPGLHRSAVFVFAATWAAATSLYVSVYLATCITVKLRQREEQVVHLSRMAQHRADGLRIACEELTQAEKAKAAYTRKVAHELRSPLSAVDGLLGAVADGLYGEVPQQAREATERARRRVRELLNVVSDLLVLASARSPERKTERVNVDVSAVLAEVMQLLAPQAEARGISVNADVCQETPWVQANPEDIQELLTNLLANAVKYSHDRGRVDVRVMSRDRWIRIEVSDSGIGIDEADIRRVFGEFYRGKNAREHTSEGTGLGLAIVRSIVSALGGTVSVSSSVGSGTTFSVQLPTAGALGVVKDSTPGGVVSMGEH